MPSHVLLPHQERPHAFMWSKCESQSTRSSTLARPLLASKHRKWCFTKMIQKWCSKVGRRIGHQERGSFVIRHILDVGLQDICCMKSNIEDRNTISNHMVHVVGLNNTPAMERVQHVPCVFRKQHVSPFSTNNMSNWKCGSVQCRANLVRSGIIPHRSPVVFEVARIFVI